MSLSAAPTFTPGSTGNIYSNPSLAASATATATFAVGLSGDTGAQGSITTGSALLGRVQVIMTDDGTVSSNYGCQVQVFSSSDNGATYDAVAYGPSFIMQTTTRNTAYPQSFDLPPGQYKLSLSNLDSTNHISVAASLGTVA